MTDVRYLKPNDGRSGWLGLDHDVALAYFEVEEFLACGGQLFDGLFGVHRNWLAHVNSGEIEYSEVRETGILHLFKLLVGLRNDIEEVVHAFEARFGPLAQAEAFRDRCRQAQQLIERGPSQAQLAAVTPPRARLRELAAAHAPPAEWYESNEESPFSRH